jgi:hypothetical protein
MFYNQTNYATCCEWPKPNTDTVGEFHRSVTVYHAHCRAGKREQRVAAGEIPANHSLTRTKLMAVAVIRCCRWVLASPM